MNVSSSSAINELGAVIPQVPLGGLAEFFDQAVLVAASVTLALGIPQLKRHHLRKGCGRSIAYQSKSRLNGCSTAVPRFPPSLPGLTPKSGVPDFGAFNVAKVGNIRLWLQSILFARTLMRRRWTTRTRVFPSSGRLDGRKSETSDLRWSSPRVTPRVGQAFGQFDRATN